MEFNKLMHNSYNGTSTNTENINSYKNAIVDDT